jgi:hypothetical protein
MGLWRGLLGGQKYFFIPLQSNGFYEVLKTDTRLSQICPTRCPELCKVLYAGGGCTWFNWVHRSAPYPPQFCWCRASRQPTGYLRSSPRACMFLSPQDLSPPNDPVGAKEARDLVSSLHTHFRQREALDASFSRHTKTRTTLTSSDLGGLPLVLYCILIAKFWDI